MQVADGGGAFLAAAQQGMFAVDTTSAKEMVMSIQQMQEKLTQRLARIHRLKHQAMLGDLPEAQVIAKRDALVASGDHQSLEFVLQRFADRLEEARHALEIGMRNYAEFEAQAERSFRQSGYR